MGGRLKFVSICCTLLSIWGFIQLLIMSLLYRFSSIALIKDLLDDFEFETEKEFYEHVDDYHKKTALSCFIASVMYFISFILSYYTYRRIQRKEHPFKGKKKHSRRRE
ncbi:ribonuclease kappa-B-like [Aethina tumida]|uniref:ribonuclease kappa-B-like n=1 Tax=Aethina tumida TaxID=116153 RepID=UPI00096B5090|nr:ribonuclease kappa-B-like [Aethina tumida]